MNIELLFTTYPFTLIIPLLILICIALCVTALVISLSSKARIKRLLNGKNSKDIDEVLLQLYKSLSILDQFRTKTIADLNNMDMRIANSVQSVETIRFNPFKGTGAGGNQSFATALINEHGDGVIISSLYSSDRVSIFAKPVTNLSSAYELTQEESESLQKAASKIQK